MPLFTRFDWEGWVKSFPLGTGSFWCFFYRLNPAGDTAAHAPLPSLLPTRDAASCPGGTGMDLGEAEWLSKHRQHGHALNALNAWAIRPAKMFPVWNI